MTDQPAEPEGLTDEQITPESGQPLSPQGDPIDPDLRNPASDQGGGLDTDPTEQRDPLDEVHGPDGTDDAEPTGEPSTSPTD